MARTPKDISIPQKTQKVLNPTSWQPRKAHPANPHQEGTHSAVMIVVNRVQMPLEELVLCRDQHVTSQAVSSLNLLEEVLLANPC